MTLKDCIRPDAAGVRWLSVPPMDLELVGYSKKLKPYELGRGIHCRALPMGAAQSRQGMAFFGEREGAQWSDGVGYRPSDSGLGEEWVRVEGLAAFPVLVDSPRVVACGFAVGYKNQLLPGSVCVHRDDIPSFIRMADDRIASDELCEMDLADPRIAALYAFAQRRRVLVSRTAGGRVAFRALEPLSKDDWMSIGYFALRKAAMRGVYAFASSRDKNKATLALPADRGALAAIGVERLVGARYDAGANRMLAQEFFVKKPQAFAREIGLPQLSHLPSFSVSQSLLGSISYKGWAMPLSGLAFAQVDPRNSMGIDVAKQQVVLSYRPKFISFGAGEPMRFSENGCSQLLVREEWLVDGTLVEARKAIEERAIPPAHPDPSEVSIIKNGCIARVRGKYYLRSDIEQFPLRKDIQTARARDIRNGKRLARERFGDHLPQGYSPIRHSFADVEKHLSVQRLADAGELVSVESLFEGPEAKAFEFFSNSTPTERRKLLIEGGLPVSSDPITGIDYTPAISVTEFRRAVITPLLSGFHKDLPRFLGFAVADDETRRMLVLGAIAGA